MDQEISIRLDSRRERAFAAAWATIALGGLVLLFEHAVVLGTIAMLLGTAAGANSLRRWRSRRPVLILDQEKLTDCRAGKVIPWHSVAEARLSEFSGMAERSHYLKLTIGRTAERARGFSGPSPAPGSIVTVPIDRLSLAWSEILALAEERLGRSVPRGR